LEHYACVIMQYINFSVMPKLMQYLVSFKGFMSKWKLGFLEIPLTICYYVRLPFTMLVLQKAVKMSWSLPEVMRVSYAFMLVMLLWMGLWSFGAAGVVASNINLNGRWWLLVVSLQVLLFIPSFFTGMRTATKLY